MQACPWRRAVLTVDEEDDGDEMLVPGGQMCCNSCLTYDAVHKNVQACMNAVAQLSFLMPSNANQRHRRNRVHMIASRDGSILLLSAHACKFVLLEERHRCCALLRSNTVRVLIVTDNCCLSLHLHPQGMM